VKEIAMHRPRLQLQAGLAALMLLAPAAAVCAEDLFGLISSTRVIRDDSRLIGDVTCVVTGAPCISFGSPRITLRLNGFTITGQADAVNGCNGGFTANEQGINSNNQTDIEIRGPGIVQRFRSDGVLFNGSLGGKVEAITATTNCQSGIRVTATSSRIVISSNISVRNGTTMAPCGGI
jgi:hypothetical protein